MLLVATRQIQVLTGLIFVVVAAVAALRAGGQPLALADQGVWPQVVVVPAVLSRLEVVVVPAEMVMSWSIRGVNYER